MPWGQIAQYGLQYGVPLATSLLRGSGQSSAANQTGQELQQAGRDAAAGIRTAANDAESYLASTLPEAAQTRERRMQLGEMYLQPGNQALSHLLGMVQPGGELNRPVTMDEIMLDPSFNFIRDEANRAIEGSAAAQGRLRSGGTIKGVGRFTSDLASREFQNAYDRLMQGRTNRLNTLSSLSQLGLSGLREVSDADTDYVSTIDRFNTNRAGNRMNSETLAQDYITSGISARGQGRIAGSQARGSIWEDFARIGQEVAPAVGQWWSNRNRRQAAG